MRKSYAIFLVLLFSLTGCSSLYVPVDRDVVALPPFKPQKEIEIALVLGGGGVKGLAHLGAIEELEKVGIRPDLIVGSSAGALAGALYADQVQIEDSVSKLLSMRRKDFFDYAFMTPKFGIVQGNLLESQVGKLLRAKTFEDLKIPLIVISTDLYNGESLELSSGDLSPAVRASCAFPGMFKPVSLYGRHCIDGGASSPVPTDIARKYGAKVVIAIDLSEKLPKKAPRHLFGVTRRGLEIGYRKLVDLLLSKADISVRMDFDDIGSFSDDQNEFIYEEGKRKMREKIPEIQALLGKKTMSSL